VDGVVTFVSRLDNNFKVSRRRRTLVSFANAPAAVPPLSPLRFAGKNIKRLRPGATNYTTTPEGTHHSKLSLSLPPIRPARNRRAR